MNKRICSLILSLLFILICPVSALADVASTSNATELNPDPYGLATMDLTDEDYGISVASSLGSVTNTISPSGVEAFIYYNDASSGVDDVLKRSDVSLESGRLSFSFVLDSGDEITKFGYSLYSNSLPSPGGYTFSFDFASDFSIDYSSIGYTVFKSRSNAGTQVSSGSLRNIDWYSGDVYCSSTEINLTNISKVNIIFYPTAPIGNAVGGDAAFSFLVADTSDSALDWLGSDTSSADYQSDVSSSLSDISSSIGDMSESLDSAAESLEYISTSQNLIIQGIDNVIMHISDQLYAFWDQLYNLIHEPTYAKLEQILAALKAIANNSDISAVVDTIEETTEEQIANDNANTAKVEEAVEKHGNFIIEGLKGLFIPSDEYFKGYFDDLYEYFSDRFGFLSFPIDLLVRLIDLFMNSSDTDCVLVLPALEISGEQLMTEQSFNLTEFLEQHFGFVLSSIRMVTSIGLIMAFVHLCQDKWNEVMRN